MGSNTETTAKERAIETFNAALELASPMYREAVKPATEGTDFEAAFRPLVTYTAFMNEFLSYVVNKIVIQAVESKMYENKYSFLKRPGFPLGTDMEYDYINPAQRRDYSITLGDTLLNRKQPDVKTVYFRRNREDQYWVTVPQPLLQGAFTQWSQLDDFITGTIRSLYTGNAIDEQNLVKALLVSSVNNGIIRQREINYDIDADPAEAALNLLKVSKEMSYLFTFPSSDFNNYQAYAQANGVTDATPAITWVENSDLFIFIRVDALVNAQLEVLAGAFNLNQAEFSQRIVPVDSFSYREKDGRIVDNENIIAIIADRKSYEYRDNLTQASDFFNSAGLYRNHYLTVWQTYAINTLGNAVAIMKRG